MSKSRGSSDLWVFSAPQLDCCLQSRVLCGRGRPPSVVRPRTLHVTSRLGTSYPRQKEKERESKREREGERERGREGEGERERERERERGDMRLVNTFMDEDTGRITTRDDWNTGSPSQIDFVISSNSLVCVDTGVDEFVDFATDHRPVWANFHFAAPTLGPMLSPQRFPRAPLGWKAGPLWSDAVACFDWDWASNWSDFSSKWCELATKHQLRKRQRNDHTLAALLHDR